MAKDLEGKQRIKAELEKDTRYALTMLKHNAVS